MISSNNIQKCCEVLINVIKNIFCDQEYEENCNKCSLCHLIDLRNLPSLKIISPEGNFIKKDQILELRNLFSKNSQYTKESVYIINYAEKMNKESANTILKFLEEPNDNIIGFFITTNVDNVIPTIQSRCQHIEVNFDNLIYESLNINKEEYEQLLGLTKKYLEEIEVCNKKGIIYNKEYFGDLEKEQIKKILQIMLEIYKSRINLTDEFGELEFLKNLSFKNIVKKINLLIKLLEEISYNVNVDLLMDKFVIEIEGINNATL